LLAPDIVFLPNQSAPFPDSWRNQGYGRGINRRHPSLKLKLLKLPAAENSRTSSDLSPRKKSKSKRHINDSDSEPEPDIPQTSMEDMRVSRDMEALDLELRGWGEKYDKTANGKAIPVKEV